ncbi:MAG: response regulator [Candidatus Methylomirabilales bacterium]
MRSEKAQKAVEAFEEATATRQAVLALAACVHCGLCAESCHYYLATGDPKMTPAYKADRVRRLYKYHADWLGRLVPRWVGGGTLLTDQDLEDLKDVVFGSCTMCRRCTLNCRFGIDNALIIRTARGLLTAQGIAPEGLLAVMRDQREVGNQMRISRADYLEVIEWLEKEAQADLGLDFRVPIDKEGAEIVYLINPREVEYAPMSLLAAFKIFHLAGADWTMPSVGWDNTNFGLFSGDRDLGAHMARLAFDQAKKLGVKKMVISECGHGYRAMKWESPNWVKANPLPFRIESVLETMADYVNQGRIVLEPSKNPHPVTYHDPCNLSRSAGITEEPRFLLKRACLEFREMYPNRADNYCCTGGGGAMSMAEYTPRRLQAAKIKADQIRATGAAIVATACHDCVDGLTDLIRRYEINIPVKNVCELIANACVIPAEKRRRMVGPIRPELKGKRILIVDDEPDVVRHLSSFLSSHGLLVSSAEDGDEALARAHQEGPDLITLDITAPGKSGVDAFMALRRDSHLQGIPVFIITGVMDYRRLMYCREVRPPEGYMGKPIDPNVLLMTIRRLLELKH